MSFGGGSSTPATSSSTSLRDLPDWIEKPAQQNIARAQMVADLGYVPNYGLDVAAFSPMQTSAMQNTANAASAFGLGAPTDVMAGMPQATTNNLGFSGYSSGDLFDKSLAELAARRPAQFLGMQQMFTDPVTGVASVPTAMDVLLNPKSTDAQIQALTGTYTQPSVGGNYDNGYDPNADNRTPLELYQDSLKWLAGDAGWMQDLVRGGAEGGSVVAAGLGALADWASKSGVEHYIENSGILGGNDYGVTYQGDNIATKNKELADRMGWAYIPPPRVHSGGSLMAYDPDYYYTGGSSGNSTSSNYYLGGAETNSFGQTAGDIESHSGGAG